FEVPKVNGAASRRFQFEFGGWSRRFCAGMSESGARNPSKGSGDVTTLRAEFDASFGKALPVLTRGRYLAAGDLPAARSVLTASAYTYVAAALAALIDVARWVRVLRF